ncbi:MAG: proton-conducting membrane transporter [Oscillibacter sp.]|nr:proton-conducting membrane transporter [Oscillibacter sp.]
MLLLVTILFPMLAGIYAGVRPMDRRKRRNWCVAAMLITDALGALCLVYGTPIALFPLTENLRLCFALDIVGRWFLGAALALYTAVTFYSFDYMEMEEREEQFYAFFFVSLGAMLSACMAGNLVSFYLCFELVTLTTVPLVLHERTKEAVAAALKYLFYSIGGAFLGLLAVIAVCVFASDANAFVPGGFLDPVQAEEHSALLLGAMFCGLIGFGAKAGMYPLHGWLPTAHPAAPAPASALLSGIVAKAGILAVIRLVYFSVGPDFLRGTWVQTAWTSLALVTVFMGSMMAFREKVMKKRLAFSTISQISYIMAGLSLLDTRGLAGGLMHVMAHAASKGALFLCAGVFIYKLGKRNVADLKGIGKQMPVTMWCFLLASLSLVGIPPMGGFVSKWAIAGAALEDGGRFALAVPAVLLLSALLTAGYLLPVVIDAFFPPMAEGHGHGAAVPASSGAAAGVSASDGAALADSPVKAEKTDKAAKAEKAEGKKKRKSKKKAMEKAEPSLWMTVPMLCLCAWALAVGLLGGMALDRLEPLLAPLFGG